MTDDDKRKQKAMILLECNEEEQNLHHLEKKARDIATLMEATTSWLRKQSDAKSVHEMSVAVQIGSRKLDPKESLISDAMNHAALMELVEEIRQSRNKLAHLNESKKNFGLI